MSRQTYSCYSCRNAIAFHYGSRVRYNLDGSLHLCTAADKAYDEYCEWLDKNARWIGWRLTGEHFWEWKRKIYDPRVEEEEARRRREALEILGLRKDLFLFGPKIVAEIESKFRKIAMQSRKFSEEDFIAINEAHDYLLERVGRRDGWLTEEEKLPKRNNGVKNEKRSTN
jgi:hypothetical protein